MYYKSLRRFPSLVFLLLCVTGCIGTRRVLPAGPYEQIHISNQGAQYPAPLYLLNFDKAGKCESPATFAEVVDRAATGEFTDIVLISHGWNNDWPAATQLYNDFIDGFAGQVASHSFNRPFRPLFIGVIWPSTLLVSTTEQGPRFEIAPAGDQRSAASAAEEENEQMLRRNARDLASQLRDDPSAQRQLAQEIFSAVRDGAGADPTAASRRARHLAEQLASIAGDEEVDRGRSNVDALLEAAQAAANAASAVDAVPAPSTSSTRRVGDNPVGNNAPETSMAPESIQLPDLRWIVRVASVWLMKDRAGVVGSNGVSQLVQQLLGRCDARIHLVGHSFGAKVVLAAVQSLPAGTRRKVDSILLLQPAVSAYSFAATIPGTDQPGKYRVVLDRVIQPVFSTFSLDDWPLTQIYQYFVVRGRDLGEAAAAPDAPPPPSPSRFAALGGFGPQPLPDPELADSEFCWTRFREVDSRYDLPSHVRVCGLRSANSQIACHGCVSNPLTWWALWNQIAASK